ncbi:MAG TPA: protease modulator HflC [Gammaproteobacteria bacterium]
MAQKQMITLIIVLAILVLGSFSFFTVKEWERAVLFQLGEVVRTDFGPGLHFKFPLVNNVIKFDGRILSLDAEPERYLTKEKKNLIVDAFVKWRIDNVTDYYTAMGGDEMRANLRLSQIIKDGLRGEFGKRTIQEVVSGERKEIMNILSANADKQAKEFGISVIDVRLKRIDLAEDVSTSVYKRMEAERKRVANTLRAQGDEQAAGIRAEADREVTVTKAEAYREAEQMRGVGDAEATEIYAKAYNKNREFYSFYRSLNAYKATFKDENDVIVFEPDTDFFKYFKKPGVR